MKKPSTLSLPSTLILGATVALTLIFPFASADTVTFNTAGTTNWVCPPGVTTIQVECWGGGGAGGAGRKDTTAGTNTSQNGGGGGGGAYARRVAVPVTPGLPYTITIPAAAVSGSAGTTTNGQGRVGGGSVTFVGDGAVTVTGAGGTGGANAYTALNGTVGSGGGAGATTAASVGDASAVFAGGTGSAGNTGATNVSGSGGGGAGDANAGGAAVTTTSTTVAGSGGVAGGGAGGAGRDGGNTNAGVGAPGMTPGGGGGGGHNQGVSTRLGGTGGLGQIVLNFTVPPNFKANNTDDLNLATSWTAFVPTGLVAEWNNTVTGANTTSLGGDLTFSGIKISDPGGLVTINPGNTLTLGAAAIDLDLTTAIQNLTLNCDIALGAANVWDVASGSALTLGGTLSGASTVTKQGVGTATLSGTNTSTAATSVTAGTLVYDAGSIFSPGGIGGVAGKLTVNGAAAVATLAGSYTATGNGDGYFEIRNGGLLNFNGTANLSGSAGIRVGEGSAGTMNMTGGTLTANMNAASNLVVGRSAGANGALNISGGTLTILNGGGISIANVAGNSGVLTVSGTGQLAMNSTGTFLMGPGTGTLNLNTGGTFTLGGNASASGTSTINFDGGTLKAGRSSATFLPATLTAVNILTGGAIIDSNGYDITLPGALLSGVVGDGGLTKTGLKTLTLSGANTYTGGTLVSAGALKFASDVPSATNVNVAGSAEAGVLVATTDGQWVNTGNLTLQNNGAVVVDYGSTAPSTTIAPIQVTDFSFGTTPGVRLISNPSSALSVGLTYPLVTWTGTGPVSGAAFVSLTHRLAGTFSVSSNTLFFTVTSNSAGTPISWNTGNGTWNTNSFNWLDGSLASTTFFDTLDSVLFGDATGATGNPTVTLGTSLSPLGITMNSTAHDYTVSGAGMISGSGSLTLDAANTRTLTLATAGNSFTGGTTVNGGILALGDATNTLLDTGAVAVDGVSAVLSLGSNSDTVGAVSLRNGAAITGSGMLTGASYAVESGNIIANLGGAGTLAKTTAGTVTLSGNNTRSGLTTMNAGTLRLSHVGAVQNTSQINLTGSSTLEFATDTAFSTLPLISGSSGFTHTIVSDRATSGAGLTHALGSANLGNSTFNFTSGPNVTSGTAGISLASVNMTAGAAGTMTLSPTTASVLIPGTVSIGTNNFAKTLALAGDTTGNEISGVISNGLNTLSLTKSGTSTWTLSGENDYTGQTTVAGGTLTLTGNRTVAPTGVGFDVLAGSTLNIAGDLAMGASQMRAGNTGGGGTVGTITQTAGAVTYTSGNQMTIGTGGAGLQGIYNLSGGSITTASQANRGLLIANNANCDGIFNLSGTGVLDVVTGSSLQICRGENASGANSTGSFIQTGGTATVSDLRMGGNTAVNNANQIATLDISAGSFSATAITALSGGNGSVSTINISGTAQVTLPEIPTTRGTGASATIKFDSGATGYLRPTASSATYMPASTFTNAKLTTNGAKFDTNSFDITVGQVLEDDTTLGTLTKLGAGTLTLGGANTYTGNTVVSAGTLALADNAQLKFVLGATSGSNNSLTGAGTATLDGDFVIDTTLADGLSAGTWTLENVATLAGAYGSTFSVVGFTDAGGDKWTKANGAKTYTFDETTGILALTSPGGYASWQSTNGTAGAIGLDHDNDGVSNGIEYFLGGTSGNTTGFTPLPGVINTAGALSVTWTKASSYPGSYGTDFVVETSATLTGVWATETLGVNVVITGNNVKYTYPAGTKRFARLKVTGP